jgi:hypothetical protein
MNLDLVGKLLWIGGAIVFWVVVFLAFRARKRGGAYRAGVAGAMYHWQNEEKQRALEIIVEKKAEERRPEYPDGNLPDLDSPKK